MTQHQILKELSKLSPLERLTIAEETLHQIHKDLDQPKSKPANGSSLAEAAASLLSDYSTDNELT
ncbi:MAG: hypothetical protein EPO24_01500, partial [Bacteroidetes bacterium]